MRFTSDREPLRGRGMTVFRVIDRASEPWSLTLKFGLSLEYDEDQNDQAVEKCKFKPYRKHIVPTRPCILSGEKVWACVHAIRGRVHLKEDRAFAGDDLVLTIVLCELKRPVRFFWGVHDFVRGLRGALLGHEYLIKVGIPHRNICENSIVLASRPEGERGFLTDFEMTALLCPTDRYSKAARSRSRYASVTGATQYTSFNTLRGGTHTHYDETESFFYVLLLFFFNYRGPLAERFLVHADFSKFLTQEENLSWRIRHWPTMYRHWVERDEDDIERIASSKDKLLHVNGGCFWDAVKEHVENNWHQKELRPPIIALLEKCLRAFADSRPAGGGESKYTRVDQRQFIKLLDSWLAEFADLEDKYSRCPFSKEYLLSEREHMRRSKRSYETGRAASEA